MSNPSADRFPFRGINLARRGRSTHTEYPSSCCRIPAHRKTWPDEWFVSRWRPQVPPIPPIAESLCHRLHTRDVARCRPSDSRKSSERQNFLTRTLLSPHAIHRTCVTGPRNAVRKATGCAPYRSSPFAVNEYLRATGSPEAKRSRTRRLFGPARPAAAARHSTAS